MQEGNFQVGFLTFVTVVVNCVVAFGKYVIPEGKSQESEEKQKSDSEIELIGALLIVTLFGLFILTYLVLLQCWWRCGERWLRKRRLSNESQDNKVKGKGKGVIKAIWKRKKKKKKVKDLDVESCPCFSQNAWEPVDLQKCLEVNGVTLEQEESDLNS